MGIKMKNSSGQKLTRKEEGRWKTIPTRKEGAGRSKSQNLGIDPSNMVRGRGQGGPREALVDEVMKRTRYDELSRTVEQLAGQIASAQQNVSTSQRPGPKCYRCGDPGHLANDCRKAGRPGKTLLVETTAADDVFADAEETSTEFAE
ncbi:hypothetical protein C5167_031334, partial [Papaver somniferum]